MHTDCGKRLLLLRNCHEAVMLSPEIRLRLQKRRCDIAARAGAAPGPEELILTRFWRRTQRIGRFGVERFARLGDPKQPKVIAGRMIGG